MKEALQYVGIGLVAWLIGVSYFTGSQSDEFATVNVHPDTSSVKNYELEANVTKHTDRKYGFFTKSYYEILEFSWPNGGYAEFNNCIVSEINVLFACTSTESDTYQMKITKFDPPESNYSSY